MAFSTPVHAFLEFCLAILCSIFFWGHVLILQMTVVKKMISVETTKLRKKLSRNIVGEDGKELCRNIVGDDGKKLCRNIVGDDGKKLCRNIVGDDGKKLCRNIVGDDGKKLCRNIVGEDYVFTIKR